MERGDTGIDQLSIFREPAVAGEARERSVPAGDKQEQSSLALSPLLRLGTSTWTYEGWQGVVYTKSYPPSRFKRDCLAEYARYQYQGRRLFRTVGFDASFYGPPSERQLAHYASLLPDDFQMCSKVWEDLTVPAYAKHPRYGTRANPHFLDAQYFMDQVLGPYETVFRRFTGPFLFEFQRALGLENSEFLERLDQFLSQLPKAWEYAVEVRHESLLTPEYCRILSRHGVSHVYNHWTSMPALLEQHKLLGELFTAPFVVLRLLTPRGVKYDDAVHRYRPYDQLKQPLPKMREETVTLAKHAVVNRRRVYALVNNRTEGSAPWTVQAIYDMMARGRQDLG